MPGRFVLASIFLAASCLPAPAQVRAGAASIAGPGCPVSFAARREGSLVARASLDGRPAPAAVSLNVHFAPASAARILWVKGTVVGASAAPHLQRLNGDVIEKNGPQERTQTFHFTDVSTHPGTLDWPVAVTSMPLVRSVSVSEVGFVDGTVWHESPFSHCSVEVNGLMLIDVPVASPGSLSPRR